MGKKHGATPPKDLIVPVKFDTPEEWLRYAARVDAVGGTLGGYGRVVLLRDAAVASPEPAGAVG